MAGKTGTLSAPLTLTDETFGERLHRAYRRGRAIYGYRYDTLAETLSSVCPISGQTILRYEEYDEAPTRPRWRANLVYVILAYGYEPDQFGLSMDDLPASVDRRLTRLLLDPSKQNYGR